MFIKRLLSALFLAIPALQVFAQGEPAKPTSTESFAIDTSFGKQGRAQVLANESRELYVSKVVPMGERYLLIASHETQGDVLAAQMITKGKVDPQLTGRRLALMSFTREGKLVSEYGQQGLSVWRPRDVKSMYPKDATVDAQGNVYILVQLELPSDSTQSNLGVVKLNPQGQRDERFGTAGLKQFHFKDRSDDSATVITIAPAGTAGAQRLLIGGYARLSGEGEGDGKGDADGGDQPSVFAMTLDGQIDTSFGTQGLVLLKPKHKEIHQGVDTLQIDAQGRIIVASSNKRAGYANTNPDLEGYECVVHRLDASGKTDKTFAGTYGTTSAAVIQQQGAGRGWSCRSSVAASDSVYVLGTAYTKDDRGWPSIARIKAAVVDKGFSNGRGFAPVFLTKQEVKLEAADLVRTPAGNLIALSGIVMYDEENLLLSAFDAEGKAANLFDGKPTMIIDIGKSSFDIAHRLLLDGQGNLLIAATSSQDRGGWSATLMKLKRSGG